MSQDLNQNAQQHQSAGSDSQVIQSGRDTHVSYGLSAAQMKEIIAVIGEQFPKFLAVAEDRAKERLIEFEARFSKRFEDETNSRRQAFEDPDFLMALRQAQHQYARAGEPSIDMLVELLAKRSLETARTRFALTLNAAIEKAAVLTENELAELSFCFLLRYVHLREADYLQLTQHLNTYLPVLLPNVSRERASYQYLESQSCAKISPLQITFHGLFQQKYPTIVVGWHPSEMATRLTPVVPTIAQAIDLWDRTPMANLELTSVGIALAYANLERFGFRADLASIIN